ncbi:hypothetical protein BJ085DRAFT_41299 [Dimargaris cristalligena]|uniref:Glutaredoxin-like protein n=1 Tax=Dimargaris cristalligena TaxID=215637 RepID=A0A4P9ZT27_9FUNG|nr:hypothetical protein BJ085DRAFT_41299 [Dimargaris cristalligena]|eukprot:RKP35882.1 hypothetical protein BJ085DRAFT_41299 [Dimargaris cristalligena]
MASSRKLLLTLFTSTTCSLCSEAKRSLLEIRKVNQARCQKYVFDIPVLYINDKFVMQHRIDQPRLLELLKGASKST